MTTRLMARKKECMYPDSQIQWLGTGGGASSSPNQTITRSSPTRPITPLSRRRGQASSRQGSAFQSIMCLIFGFISFSIVSFLLPLLGSADHIYLPALAKSFGEDQSAQAASKTAPVVETNGEGKIPVGPVEASINALRRRAEATDNTQANGDTKAGSVGGNSDNPKVKVIYTVFAGRRNRLLLQEPYWKDMVDKGQVDEVHLWDFCTYEHDRKHLQSLGEKYPSFLKIMLPQDVDMSAFYWFDKNHSLAPGSKDIVERYGDPTEGRAKFRWPPRRGYQEYFQYYAFNSQDNPNDVIIKGDDDIVWINTTEVRPFAEYLFNHKEIFLLSASVVNQGVTVHHQQQHGAVPPEKFGELELPGNGMGSWHDNSAQAKMLHEYFLSSEEARQKFYITDPIFIPFTFTINVNFIAMRRSDFPEYNELAQERCVEDNRYYDEGTMTWEAIRKRKKLEGIYMPLVANHATFGAQDDKTEEILKLYVDYGRNELSSFYGNILDDWSYAAPK